MSSEQELELTAEEQAMLGGKEGPAVQRAIEIVVALGKIYGARRLVPVRSVQVAGVSFKNLGQAGLDFLRQWAAQGARVRVPTTLNPAGVDMQNWRALGFPEAFARQQQAVLDTYTAMGISPTCTCTPYLVGNRPAYGEHIAWAESSAVSFANSVLGARTNREGGPSALAAAICGRTAAYGLHLDENRLAHYRVDVYCPLQSVSDWSALGYMVGRQVRDGVPYLILHREPCTVPDPDALDDDPLIDRLKSLGAAMAASGAVGLYHIAGVTPEARRMGMLAPDVNGQRLLPTPCEQVRLSLLPARLHRTSGVRRIVIEDLAEGYAALNSIAYFPIRGVSRIDLVSIGCPHASPSEIRQIARAVAGQRIQAALWVTTARQTRERMALEVRAIEAAGGRVVADTCMVVAPVEALGFHTMATPSAKMAFYAPSHSGLQVRFGTLEQCIAAALSGTWDVHADDAPLSPSASLPVSAPLR